MGAIFGVIGSGPETDLRAMGDRLAHRGPHVSLMPLGRAGALGTVCRDPVAATATRGPLTIVCDATLYNGSDLMARLAAHQLEPETASPAAVLLALYEAFGLEAIELVDGDFACVIVDEARDELVLARDFFGCRPLYFTRLPGPRLAFASEYKALLALPDVVPEVDRDMVQYLQCAKRVPVGRTLLANIAEAMPGRAVRLTTAGVEVQAHACPPLQVDARIHEEPAAVEVIRRQLTEAVRRRSADLDRIGLALSGGIDSIAVAFLLRQLHPDKEIHTFTAGWGSDDPEIQIAAKAAARIGSHHHEVTTSTELLRSERLRDLVWHMEEPFSRSESLQLLELGRAASEHVPVLFCAHGADSLFAGMPRYMVFYFMQLVPMLRGGLQDLYNLSQYSLPPRTLIGSVLNRLHYRGKVPPAPEIPGARWPEPPAPPAVGLELINLKMAAGFQLGVCTDIHKYERTLAAFGVEYRSPFYDLELVRSAYTITDRLKIRNRVEKYILRSALSTIVDDEFCHLAKFPQRMKYDLAFADALDAVAASTLSEEAVRGRGLFEPEGIRRLFRSRADRPYAPEAAMRLWTAVLTELWAQQFVDGRSAIGRKCQDDVWAEARPGAPRTSRTGARSGGAPAAARVRPS